MIENQKNLTIQKQQKLGIFLTAAYILAGILFAFRSGLYAFYWFSGLGFGYVLQKSRFCFTAGFRDPHLLDSTKVSQAILLALGITTLGFAAVKYAHILLDLPIPGMDYINSIGLYTLIGGILFGIGMVIAGGCASGVLMRIGDGFATQLVVLTFFIIGSLLGVGNLPWWTAKFSLVKEGIFLPDILGWPGAVGAQLLLILALYLFAKRWEAKKMEE